jgi:uncharacterized protein (TIGR00369 family)
MRATQRLLSKVIPIPGYKERILNSFNDCVFIETIGARIDHIAPGAVDISISSHSSLMQQHGFLHAGVTTTIADTAAGYAAYSLFPKDTEVVTSELKMSYLNPAICEKLIAHGRIVKSGKSLSTARADVYGRFESEDKPDVHVATGLMTMFVVHPKENKRV